GKRAARGKERGKIKECSFVTVSAPAMKRTVRQTLLPRRCKYRSNAAVGSKRFAVDKRAERLYNEQQKNLSFV
ncbi:MAG: hypothetical protein MJ091_06285, partial [Clostridia bacterium]|nr:hypothetical protein [Clostridia bacterium]